MKEVEPSGPFSIVSPRPYKPEKSNEFDISKINDESITIFQLPDNNCKKPAHTMTASL